MLPQNTVTSPWPALIFVTLGINQSEILSHLYPG